MLYFLANKVPKKILFLQPHSKLLTDLERFKIVIKQSVSLPGSVDGLQNRDLGDELRKLKVSKFFANFILLCVCVCNIKPADIDCLISMHHVEKLWIEKGLFLST